MNGHLSSRPLIMGILNITPDSFSDGGDYYRPDAAVGKGLQMADEGADIIDVGGESTRPGAQRVDAGEQIRRVVPVIERLRPALPDRIVISVDTTSAEVAGAAVAAGAGMINDISSGEDDPEGFQFAARAGVPVILMHKQGTPESMQLNPEYDDVVGDIISYLVARAGLAMEAGISRDNLVLDPGFGFGKTMQHNLQLLAGLEQLVDTGFQIMIGTSRKTFLSRVCEIENRKDLIGATCATTALGVQAGIRLFRVHDVRENRQAADVAYATLVRSEGGRVRSEE